MHAFTRGPTANAVTNITFDVAAPRRTGANYEDVMTAIDDAGAGATAATSMFG